MTVHRARYGPHNAADAYVDHGIAEQVVDLGEFQMNYAREGARDHLPVHLRAFPIPDEPPQNLKEYEWGRAFWSGAVAASCDHERMLRAVRVPSDQQAARVRELLAAACVQVTYQSLPDVGHSMHAARPDLYVTTQLDWVASLEPAQP